MGQEVLPKTGRCRKKLSSVDELLKKPFRPSLESENIYLLLPWKYF